MELKDRKYIRNTRLLPRFEGESPDANGGVKNDNSDVSSGGNVDYSHAITGTLGALSSVYGAHLFTTTDNDYINKYGARNANIGGIGYTRYNNIDKSREMDIVGAENSGNTINTTLAGAGAGAAIGTIIPGVGNLVGAGVGALVGGLAGLAGGLFGGSHRKHKARQAMREAQLKVDNYNEMNRSYALTDSFRLNQAEQYGDSRSQLLFSADNGKSEFVDPGTGRTLDDHLVDSAEGMKTDKQNAWVSEGEGIWNRTTKDAHLVTRGKNDTARASLKDNDTVFGKNINPFTGNEFKQDAMPYIMAKEKLNKLRPKGSGWLGKQTQDVYDKASSGINANIELTLNNLADTLNMVLSYNKYKNGMPKANYGLTWWGNAVPAFTGMAASLGQYFSAKKDKPYKPDTFVANKYLNKGLETLADLRISPYSTILLLRDAEARTNNAVNMSGGLSTAQKNLARIASLHGTQQLVGNMLNSIQAQNNAYKSTYANALLQSGESEAQRRQAAKQYDLDYYSKAHAARQQMMQMGMRNFLDNLNQYSANEFKRKSAIANLKMYADSNAIEREKIKAWLKGPENPISNTNVTVNNTSTYTPQPQLTDKLNNYPSYYGQPQQEDDLFMFVPGPGGFVFTPDFYKRFGGKQFNYPN